MSEGLHASPPLLEMRGISKRFASTQALSQVDFTVRRGWVHGIVGENGAGKSTLMRVLAGICRADDGEIIVDGEAVAAPTPQKLLSLGVAAIHQELAQAPHLTVAENIFLGRLPTTRLGRVDWRAVKDGAATVLASLGFAVDPLARIDGLSIAERQMVEIARAIAANARIIVLDEPSAALGEGDLARLFETIRCLRRENGLSFLYITHRLQELYAICDDVTVMRDGTIVARLPIADVRAPDLVRQMAGRELDSIFPPRSAPDDDVCLKVANLRRGTALQPVSFELRRGEILGIYGLTGSGRTTLLRLLAGAERADGGAILRGGIPVTLDGPRQALAQGIGFLPEDRKTEGLFLDQSVAFNITLSSLDSITHAGIISGSAEKARTHDMIARLGIKTPSAAARLATLSGGNQQKCAIARLLQAGAQILLLDEPTRGVDVAARHDIYDLLARLAAQGASIILVSSELSEILGLCHRIMVMREGAVSAILDAGDATQDAITSQAVWQ